MTTSERDSRAEIGKKRALIVGAGISGLSAAFRLGELAPDVDYEIWERSDRVGGVIGTRVVDGFLCELSVDNFITTLPEGVELCKKLGLQDELTSTNNRYRRTFVARKGKLHPLPDGFMTMAPTKLWPMLTTPLLTPFGKLRCGLELLLPRRRSTEEESLAAFAIRRLGKEAFDRIIEPLVGGIYGGDASKLSLQATLPRFAEMEKKDRSIIWSMVKSKPKAKRDKREEESGARYSFFITLRSGMRLLPETLAARVGRERVSLGRAVVKADRVVDASGRESWRVEDDRGRAETFDAILFATDTKSASTALRESAPDVARLYGATDRTSVVIVHLAYRNDQLAKPFEGMGFVVPPSEGNGVIAGSFSSYKYPFRAPENTTLLRLFLGGARAPDAPFLEESELVDRVRNEMRTLVGARGEPIMTDVARFPDSMPQYYVGRLAWRAELARALESYPTLALAGSALDGVGLPTCVKSGNEAAARIVASLAKTE